MPKKILLAEDEPDILKVVRYRLIKKGYEVITAANGKEAILLLEEHMPDLILADVKMPLMGGLEILKFIKENARLKHIPILFITASSELLKQESRDQLLNEDVFLKPIEMEKLTTRIEELLIS
jgi:two-component system alkaline phosphatase synthesis response regulator PhoP